MPSCSEINCCKKLKITDLKCRCGNQYCYIHRLPETHNCSFNFKLEQKEKDKISEQMKCINPKMIKI